MAFGIECVVLCLVMWLMCFIGTGGDKNNLKSLRAYPLDVQQKVKEQLNITKKDRPETPVVVFLTNLLTFSIILFIFGLFIRTDDFVYNFIALLILGEVANLFDLLIIDMLWWRNTKRIRFSFIPEKEAYQNPKQHIISFVKGAVMFVLVALIDGAILMTF